MVTNAALERALAQMKRLSKAHYQSDFTRGYEMGLDHAIQVMERVIRLDGEVEPAPKVAHASNDDTLNGDTLNGPWPRPSYHKRAEGVRCADIPPEGDAMGLQLGVPPRLMAHDGPVVDELPGWTALKRAMNGGGERET